MTSFGTQIKHAISIQTSTNKANPRVTDSIKGSSGPETIISKQQVRWY